MRAAYYAAKAERAAPFDDDSELHPTTWFAVVKRYSDIAYYQQVLHECGCFAGYLKR